MPSATPKKSEKATPTSASAGAGGTGAGAGKRKRPRKSKKRTTGVVSDSSDDDESSDEEDEAAPAQQVKKAASKKQFESDSDSDSDSSSSSSSSSSSDSESEEEVKESRGSKRKRKRKRASDKNQVKKVEESATVAKKAEPRNEGATREQIQQLGEPEEDGALGEPAKRALEYARQYHLDRPAWKFNKARQLWLIRHALSMPTSEGLSANPSEDVANKEAVSKENKDPSKEEEEEEEEIPPFWTDRWTVLAGSYLATVQGGAKERLIGSLREAATAEIPAIPQRATAEAEDSFATSAADEKSKSVSFGDLAMTKEAKDAADGPSDADIALAQEQATLVKKRKARAQQLLQAMGESL
ncbi:hypothetical protein FA10DRAFT_82277 [Acaromyces ingoldii]|uniref:WKF domain-containing protein n=1 Tax=Acaromyces ingoldii TaxID=215250 RepID=A0A316YRQ9_9BASI|nr:hypothetical protein FA10DRAFT_82277 [Acaromyces ingoldii]PWN92067.1 hypothetical protein FA10DRAFT_82277 [Acaromyces ingoldii]